MEFDVESWREELVSYREQKDEQFEVPHSSPLGPEGRKEFDGLEYFEPDPDYRVETTVELDGSDETVAMETTADGEQLYERTARLHFEVPNASGEPTEETLVGYTRVDQDEGSLFVPFRDKTTGQQTYNPFCAYTAAYECPLPPRENWLEVAIPAGERYEE